MLISKEEQSKRDEAHQKFIEECRVKQKASKIRMGKRLTESIMNILGNEGLILIWTASDKLHKDIFDSIEEIMIDEGYSYCDDCEQRIREDGGPSYRYNEGMD
jgi:hypothetical protein